MEVNPGYKQTEVGVIPEEWGVRWLGSIATLERGKFTARPRNQPRFFGGDIPFIQTGDITNSNGSITSYTQTLNNEGLRVSKLFPRETLFFTIAANIGDVGIAAFETAATDSVIAISPHRGIEKRWLYHSLRWQKATFEGLATQNAQANINLEKLRPYSLAVPPQPEQRAIAGALGDVDALLGAMEKLIAKKRDLKKAAMQQLLTGQTRLPGFNGEWEAKRLGEVAQLIPSGIYGEEKPRGNLLAFPVATTAHIEEDDTWNNKTMSVRYFPQEQITRYSTVEGDLIIVKSSGSAAKIQSGKIGFVDKERAGKFLFSNFLMLLRPTSIAPRFLNFYLCSYNVRKLLPTLVEASTYPNIRLEDYLDLEIPIPSPDEQTAIAAVLSDMDAEIVGLEQRLAKTRALKQGMMQELLTGRVRLL